MGDIGSPFPRWRSETPRAVAARALRERQIDRWRAELARLGWSPVVWPWVVMPACGIARPTGGRTAGYVHRSTSDGSWSEDVRVSVPPGRGWPERLAAELTRHVRAVHGGEHA